MSRTSQSELSFFLCELNLFNKPMVSPVKSFSCVGISFFQLRWKPFEIPKTSQKKVDFVSVSQSSPCLPLPSCVLR